MTFYQSEHWLEWMLLGAGLWIISCFLWTFLADIVSAVKGSRDAGYGVLAWLLTIGGLLFPIFWFFSWRESKSGTTMSRRRTE